MKEEGLSVYSFKVKTDYPAVVTKISHDRVNFNIYLDSDMKLSQTATFYVRCGNVNLFQIFRIGQKTKVKVKQIFRQEEIVVVPDTLPIDDFIKKNPTGSRVTGIITSITGATMTVTFGKNVSCITKRCKHAKNKLEVVCKINHYNPQKKTLSVAVV